MCGEGRQAGRFPGPAGVQVPRGTSRGKQVCVEEAGRSPSPTGVQVPVGASRGKQVCVEAGKSTGPAGVCGCVFAGLYPLSA